MDAARLRAEFPVFERVAYLNAGTCGPLPAAARRAVDEVVDLAEVDGRRGAYHDRHLALQDRQREAYAALLGARVEDVALTTSTSEGIGRVLAGLDLGPGDEVLTSDAEHPGLLGPLLGARQRSGIAIRTAPLAELPDHVGERTRLIACSHVGWVSGDVAPALDGDVPVLLDGAQGVGAVPVDVAALGCAFYAGSGQKWLCGPVGTGMLYVAAEWQERLTPTAYAYPSYEDSSRALDPDALHRGARRFDASARPPELEAAALAALDVLAGFGWDRVHERARSLAARLAERLAAEAGRTVAPRGDTTLVAWAEPDPPAACDRLAAAGVAVRHLPGTSLVRASVGAWNDDGDLDALLSAL
ncbi:MAG TPA: aminotransferase class V-fold PLP-dependent enzyme [Solirubrobacteraceae bacterium]|nr:aminotransferase class V-fold PLP-dependent enzyme [Solirubrobacteraceae bacterium]